MKFILSFLESQIVSCDLRNSPILPKPDEIGPFSKKNQNSGQKPVYLKNQLGSPRQHLL